MPKPRVCQVVRRAKMEDMFLAPAVQGSRVVELSQKLFQGGFPLRVVQDYAITNRDAEVHPDEDDLWLCVNGSVTFCYGGRLEGPQRLSEIDNTVLAPQISGGRKVTLKPGDWFLIPAGQPHQHATEGLATLIIIRLPVKSDSV